MDRGGRVRLRARRPARAFTVADHLARAERGDRAPGATGAHLGMVWRMGVAFHQPAATAHIDRHSPWATIGAPDLPVIPVEVGGAFWRFQAALKTFA
jgi:hypothetical protein